MYEKVIVKQVVAYECTILEHVLKISSDIYIYLLKYDVTYFGISISIDIPFIIDPIEKRSLQSQRAGSKVCKQKWNGEQLRVIQLIVV